MKMNKYKEMIGNKKTHIRIFRKLMKVDTKAQREARTLWLDNALDCIDYDDYYGSEKEMKIRAKAKTLTTNQLANYMIDCYDAPLDMGFSKKAINTLNKRERNYYED